MKQMMMATWGVIRWYFCSVLHSDNLSLDLGKILLMLQALKRGHAIDPSNPHFHMCAVLFLKAGMHENWEL